MLRRRRTPAGAVPDHARQPGQPSQHMQRVHGGEHVEERTAGIGGEVKPFGAQLAPGNVLAGDKEQTEHQSVCRASVRAADRAAAMPPMKVATRRRATSSVTLLARSSAVFTKRIEGKAEALPVVAVSLGEQSAHWSTRRTSW